MKKILKKIKKKLFKSSSPKQDIDIVLEHGVKIGHNVSIYGHDYDLKYGPLLSIGDNVTISESKILLHDASTNKFIGGGTKVRPVKIGNNIFVGYGSIILPGAIINDNVIVGAGTVVRGEVPGDSVIIGNPWQRVCSFTDYIEHHKKNKENAVLYTGNDFNEVAKMIEEGKDIYI